MLSAAVKRNSFLSEIHLPTSSLMTSSPFLTA